MKRIINTKDFTERNTRALNNMIINDEIELIEELPNGKMLVEIKAVTLLMMKLANAKGTINWDIEA